MQFSKYDDLRQVLLTSYVYFMKDESLLVFSSQPILLLSCYIRMQQVFEGAKYHEKMAPLKIVSSSTCRLQDKGVQGKHLSHDIQYRQLIYTNQFQLIALISRKIASVHGNKTGQSLHAALFSVLSIVQCAITIFQNDNDRK